MEDKIKKGVEDFNNRFTDVMKDLKEKEYKSHYCCFEQDTPACGIEIDEHTRCCICEKRMPEEQEWEARKRLKAPPFDKEESKSTEQILTEILAEIHTLPKSYAKSFSGGQLREAGYLEAKRDIARIIKEKILELNK